MLFSRPKSHAKRNEPIKPHGTERITAIGTKKLSYRHDRIKKISTISGYASGVLIALIWALMIAEVIMRNIFHHPILGCSEICVFMYVSASYFGFSFTQIYKGHITVDLLYTNLKPAGQRALDIISLVLESILFVAFTYCSWKSFATSFAAREIYLAAMRMPVYVLRFAIALGVTIMALQVIADTVETITKKKEVQA